MRPIALPRPPWQLTSAAMPCSMPLATARCGCARHWCRRSSLQASGSLGLFLQASCWCRCSRPFWALGWHCLLSPHCLVSSPCRSRSTPAAVPFSGLNGRVSHKAKQPRWPKTPCARLPTPMWSLPWVRLPRWYTMQ